MWKMVKKRKKELKNEMKDYVKIFNKLFQQKSFNKAMEYLDFIKYELGKFPKFLTNYLN